MKISLNMLIVFIFHCMNIYAQDNCPSTIEYAGQTYHTVQIGDQCWLKENLNVGTMILGKQNQTNNGIIEKYCYENDPNNCNTYGGLYQWNEAVQYVLPQSTQGICPNGWHIPSNSEFLTLCIILNNDGNALQVGGSNTSGFSSLLAGYHINNSDSFITLGGESYFWSSTGGRITDVYAIGLNLGNHDIYLTNYNKSHGYSVRCLKN
jgi:uncharacterized protein (TIGR02145 family)